MVLMIRIFLFVSEVIVWLRLWIDFGVLFLGSESVIMGIFVFG